MTWDERIGSAVDHLAVHFSPTWHQSMPQILWGITTPGSCQWWGVLHGVFDSDSDMAWYMLNKYQTLIAQRIQASSITWLVEPQIQLQIGVFHSWFKMTWCWKYPSISFQRYIVWPELQHCHVWKSGWKDPRLITQGVHISHVLQESPSVEVSFTGAGPKEEHLFDEGLIY